MLLTLPAARALKAAYPACRITVLASAANAVAARHHPDVDQVEVDAYEAKGSGMRGVVALAQRLRGLACDAAVVVHPTPRLAFAIYMARIPVRVGTAYRAYSWLFNHRVAQHRRHTTQHESQLNVELLAPLGVTPAPVVPVVWTVEPHERAAAEALLKRTGCEAGRFVVLHPGNAGSAMNWAPEQYSDLGRRLVEAQFKVAVTGGNAETELTRQVVSGIPGAVDLGGQLTLPELAAVLQRAAVYVGSATGPTHLAAAVGLPVVAL
jgi:ADP-heptose:LPS heptosyltransferase